VSAHHDRLGQGYPPRARLKGRQGELDALVTLIQRDPRRRIALVGAGGSGKSLLANALGHRLRAQYEGGTHWFRSGPWDTQTLAQMMAVRFHIPPARKKLLKSLRKFLADLGPTFIVLDNHENDAAVCRLFNELADVPVTFVLTARRCLLAGVYVFPVTAPQATTGRAVFPRVHLLTHLLRHNPLALDIADAIVMSGATDAHSLRDWLVAQGVQRVRVIDHEDDLPEVALLVAWHWPQLSRAERRMLAVLAHSEGDHLDADSVAALSGLTKPAGRRALERLVGWRLVQTPLPDRYALHAVVRHSVSKRTKGSRHRMAKYYLDLLERQPHRFDLEQTHLYAAMDFAHDESRLDWMLRIDRLLERLADSSQKTVRDE
jgi:hypothetical protein